MLASIVVADTCDTYKHPTYGYGSCVDVSLCPNALYISGLCESKPTSVKCCFSATSGGSGVQCTTEKLSHTTAANYVKAEGIAISSSGGCSDRLNSKCTSLEQINCKSIKGIINYKKVSGCSITITGGSETGHSSGTYSHWNGYKLDISVSTCHSNYITSKYTYVGQRPGDNAALYKDPSGNQFALEGNHWDITFY